MVSVQKETTGTLPVKTQTCGHRAELWRYNNLRSNEGALYKPFVVLCLGMWPRVAKACLEFQFQVKRHQAPQLFRHFFKKMERGLIV